MLLTMQNIRLLLEYDGSRYRGWKAGKKEETSTICGKLTEVLRRMTDEDVVLTCGANTESGVHAKGQVAQFKTNSTLSVEEMKTYLNQYLPLDIAILQVEKAQERFHAELNSHWITYEYEMQIGEVEDVFQRKYVDFRTKEPNVEAMEQMAEKLLGVHDFQNFSAGRTKKTTVRELSSIKIQKQGERLKIRMIGNGFLKQMPQKIISLLLDVGYGTGGWTDGEELFEGKKQISVKCVEKALFLTNVDYDL